MAVGDIEVAVVEGKSGRRRQRGRSRYRGRQPSRRRWQARFATPPRRCRGAHPDLLHRARPTEIVPGPQPKSRTRWPDSRCGSRCAAWVWALRRSSSCLKLVAVAHRVAGFSHWSHLSIPSRPSMFSWAALYTTRQGWHHQPGPSRRCEMHGVTPLRRCCAGRARPVPDTGESKGPGRGHAVPQGLGGSDLVEPGRWRNRI